MPVGNEAAVAGAELERVRPKLQKIYEQDNKFYASIEKKDVEKVSYRQMRIPMEIRPGGSFGYFNPDGGDLGRGGAPVIDKAVVQCVFVVEAIEYTKLAQWSTDDERKSIVNAVRHYTANAIVELRRQMDSQSQQNGTGAIGTITTASASGGVDTYVMTTDGFGTRLIRAGQVIQVFDSTLATNRGKGTVIANDVENNTVTLSPSITGATTGDRIITDGITSPSSLPALYGVPYHHSNASTGIWLGYNRATTPEIRSNRVNASGSGLSLPFARLLVNKIGNRMGIDEDFDLVAWNHPCQAQAYEAIGQLVSIIHKQPKEEALNMYFGDSMQLAGAPMRKHFNWDKTRIDFINKSVWGRGEILPIGFYKTDGRTIFEIRASSGGVTTADIFYMTVGTQFFVTNPAATGFIDNLAVPSGY